MRVWFITLTLVLLTACSTTQLPISPHKIDVQQGNVIDQDTLDKLKPGLTRSQVRFLLGTPLMVDPFRDNRWDYVYNYRSAGKLTAQTRVTLFFDGDVLNRIETIGLDQPHAMTEPLASTTKAEPVPPEPACRARGQPIQQAEPQGAAPEASVAAESTQPSSDRKPDQQAQEQSATQAVPAQVKQAESPAAKPTAPKKRAKAAKRVATTKARRRVPTSVVPPLEPSASKPASSRVGNSPPQPVALKSESNVNALKPDVMPEFPQTPAVSNVEAPVLAALKSWAKAWSDRDEEAYFSAYASNFKPSGALDKAEWERRRRLLLNLSKKIEVRVDSPVVEFPAEGRALITFNQSYRSATYQDTIVKQLVMVLQDGRWLILEEKVLPVSHGKKKK